MVFWLFVLHLRVANLLPMHIKLRQLREEKGISQEEMGQLLSISQPQYHRKESGLVHFSLEEEKLLSGYFDKPVDELFVKQQNNEKQKEGTAVIYYIVDKLVEEGKLNSRLKEMLKEQKEENRLLKNQLEKLRREK